MPEARTSAGLPLEVERGLGPRFCSSASSPAQPKPARPVAAASGPDGKSWWRALPSLPARAAGGLIWIYQHTISPALAVANPSLGCRFAPTCSHYSRQAFAEHGFLAGAYLTLRRLAKCGPWHPGGEDPVPLRQLRCRRASALEPQACCARGQDGVADGRRQAASLPV